jgi:hypothetical protein
MVSNISLLLLDEELKLITNGRRIHVTPKRKKNKNKKMNK